MDCTSKEKRKEQMREYNKKRIYALTNTMAADDLYTTSSTTIGNDLSHTEAGTASINQIHRTKKKNSA
jgi:hypothetical protein